MNILIICEKNNAAQRIAQILSAGKVKRTFHKKVPVYDFENREVSFTVVGLKGHILTLDFPEGYNNWQRVHPSELIHVDPLKRVNERSIYTTLKDLAREADEVIIATDYDREGELIGVEALEVVKKFNPEFSVQRARFSSLTNEEITQAFSNLTMIDFNLSEAAECRQIIDLIWGAVLTRYLSLAANQMGRDFLSAGRVQSPTLALIVDREREIKNFQPEPYWEIEGMVEGPIQGEESHTFKTYHVHGRFLDKDTTLAIHDRTKHEKSGIVQNVERTTKKEKPPAPLNTTSFLRVATSRGFSPASAMAIAENLYNQGLISYPRTDNTVYPASLNLREILTKLMSTPFKELAEKLLLQEKLKPTRGKKQTTDHPPIYPSGAASKADLTPEEWKIYDLVVRRFMATLAPDAVSETIKARIAINGEMFKSSGYRILVKGWQEFDPYIKRKEIILPTLKENDRVMVHSIDLLSKMTKPPNRYSQGGLIQLMDSLNLGTKSTRHEIIQKLYQRGYLVESPPMPTDTAYTVIDTLEKYSPIIAKSEMTSTLEKDMTQIANGDSDLGQVISESREMLSKAMDLLVTNRMEVRRTLQTALQEQNKVGICPQCGKTLIIRQSRYGKRFIGCTGYPSCNVTYPLPQRGRIIPVEKTCQVCGSPIVKLITRRRRPRDICVNIQCSTNQRTGQSDMETTDQLGEA